jgi:hypothetical protein
MALPSYSDLTAACRVLVSTLTPLCRLPLHQASLDGGELCLLQGWVRTDMTSRNGLIDAAESAGGLISVLESGLPLNGHWCARCPHAAVVCKSGGCAYRGQCCNSSAPAYQSASTMAELPP